MDKDLESYVEKRIGSADEYYDFQGMDIRIAVLKANDLYYTIGEAKVELSYVEKEYYENSGFNTELVRYIHLKHAVQDLNRMYDIALQIPWFLYRIWTEEKIFSYREKKDKDKAKSIIRNTENWIFKSEELCKERYVKKYLELKKSSNHDKLLNLLYDFKNNFIYNKNKDETIRTLCNHIKHKGNIQPEELKGKTNFKFILNNEVKEADKIVLVPKTWKIPKKCNIYNSFKTPNIVFNNEKEFIIDLMYDDKKENFVDNFYGKDIIGKSFSIDKIYSECINYLKEFKPIYDLYIVILEEYLYRILPQAEIQNTSSINLNELYQKK
ncbi:hypothetical protein FC777_09460 [Clostridium botulinum]|nr:hypothetical protein [Clostridium botulinum]